MLRFEFKWWVWLVAALVVYMIFRGPGAMSYLFGGLIRGFMDIGNAIVRLIEDVHQKH
jgi:hypothetical protein